MTKLTTVPPRRFSILPMSSHFKEGIEAQVKLWRQVSPDAFPELLALQSAAGDHTLRFRAAFSGDSAKGPAAFFKEAPAAGDLQNKGKPRVGFLFSGQGSHHPRMGAALYRRFAVFRCAPFSPLPISLS